MRREHRPHYVKRARAAFDNLYARHFLYPHLDSVGEGICFANPWHVHFFGPSIHLGRCVNIMAAPGHAVTLTVWPAEAGKGEIRIGDYTIINPGVRIGSADRITVGHNCMIAARAYITDADWHDTYDRVYSRGRTAPVCLEENVWVGDSAIVCKGVTIGKNSIIGAGAVVVRDIPQNSVAAGNPAKVVKSLDGSREFITRESLLSEPEKFFEYLINLEKELLRGNSILGWLRYLLFPAKGD